MELFELKKVDIALPVVVKLHQLEQEAKRKGLLDELKKTSSFRLELPCSNGSKVFDRLQAACKVDNISLVVEPNAQDRLKKPLLKTNYVVFLEDITPEELTRWLIRVAAEDREGRDEEATGAATGSAGADADDKTGSRTAVEAARRRSGDHPAEGSARHGPQQAVVGQDGRANGCSCWPTTRCGPIRRPEVKPGCDNAQASRGLERLQILLVLRSIRMGGDQPRRLVVASVERTGNAATSSAGLACIATP